MSNLKLTIEKHFETLGHKLYHHRLKTILLVFLAVGALISQLPKITVDTSAESLLRKDDKSVLVYNEFKDEFGSANITLIGVQSSNIFSNAFLQRLKSFQEDLEKEVPYIEDITSLINVRNTRGEDDTLYVDSLLEQWPQTESDLNHLKERALKHPYYVDNVISRDGALTAIIIKTRAIIQPQEVLSEELDDFEENAIPDLMPDKEEEEKNYFSEKENQEFIRAVESVIKRYDAPDFAIALTGGPPVSEIFDRATRKDFSVSFVLTTSVVILFLIILFQRVSGVILPFIPIYGALFATISLMAIFKSPLTLFTTILPAFLIAVGVADSIHILAVFYRNFEQGKSKEDAIAYAMGHSGLAIVMTTLTTAAGLLSFSYSELAALASLGIFAATGVMLALIFTLILIPPLIALFPMKRKRKKVRSRTDRMDRVLLFFADFSYKHPTKIILISSLIFAVTLAGLSELRLSHNVMGYFPDHMAIKHDNKLVDDKLKGTLVLIALVDTKQENGLYEPDILKRIETVTRRLLKLQGNEIYVGKVFSIIDIIKETNLALHDNDPNFYALPEDRETIAQELLLFENSGSDDLEQIVDIRYSKSPITIKIPYVDIIYIEQMIEDIEQVFEDVFDDRVEITLTGLTSILSRVLPAAQRSMAKSYLIAFVVITIMMIVLIGSFKFGLFSMIPNLLPITMIMGIMGLIGVPLDMNSLMIGSVAIGLVVDDTMHFMYNFRKYYGLSGNVHEAIRETLLGTGRAILITSLVLSASFFSIMGSTLKSSINFGFYTGLVILAALLADFLLAPALMTLLLRKVTALNSPAIEKNRKLP
ncbi:MAG: MMPL family transporter [Desulfobacterales bacterium]